MWCDECDVMNVLSVKKNENLQKNKINYNALPDISICQVYQDYSTS